MKDYSQGHPTTVSFKITLKTLLDYSDYVLQDLWKCISSGAIKFVSVQSSLENLL